jgi:hypothetical protein
MSDDNLLATLDQNLRQTLSARARLSQRLLELEGEVEKIRTELGELDKIARQTEAAILRLLNKTIMTPGTVYSNEADDFAPPVNRVSNGQQISQGNGGNGHAASFARQPARNTSLPPDEAPAIRNDIEVVHQRFVDRTIPQAVTMLLKETGPLHVNEIYNKLVEGGYSFTGHHPTISIAVSLNRNRRFRKVAPGTFDLVMRNANAAQAS